MRIMQLCAGAATGGAETAYIDTCIALHRAGMDIVPVCRPHRGMVDALTAAGMTPVTLPFGGVFDFYTPYKIRQMIKTHRPAIVQTWMNRAAGAMPRCKTGLPPYRTIARLGGYYKLKYYKAADHFVVNTPDIGRYLEGVGITPDRITHINNFVPIATDVVPVLRRDLDTSDEAFVFLTLARLHTNKGIDVFLRALATLPDRAVGWIAGDGPERSALESLAATLGITDRVRFLGWRDDRYALLAAANTLVFPSRFEPFGNSFAQAWGMGCPLITTASQGPMQYVRDGYDAIVTPIDDVDALSAAMRRMMDDPTLANYLTTNAWQRFAQEFTVEACVMAYTKLYNTLSQ